MKTRSEPPADRLGSARTVLVSGLLLGVLIMVGVLAAVLQDRDARLDAARRQSLTLANGADRLLHYELRNLERAMAGIAADADAYRQAVPSQAPGLVSEAIAGVLSRHAELQSIVLHDPSGAALSNGRADPQLRRWLSAAPVSTTPGRLAFGSPQQVGTDALLPIALRTPQGNWLVVRLRTSELLHLVQGMDTGRQGGIGILDQKGQVLARAGDRGNYVGRRITLPGDLHGGGTVALRMRSQLDQVARQAAFASASGYPLVVFAGISVREALAPWRNYATTAAVMVLLYWLALAYVVRRMRANEAVRETMLVELRTQADWLRQAQVAARSGVWRMASEEGMVRASAQAAGLFGFDANDAIIPLAAVFERIHPLDRARVEQAFDAARERREPFHAEYRVVMPDAGERWISARGDMAPDPGGMSPMTGTIVDISERRDALARLERAELQFRELFERNPLPCWVYDSASLEFLAVNASAISSYGYSRKEFLARRIGDILHDASPAVDAAPAPDAAVADDPERVEVHRRSDNSLIHVRVHSRAIQFEGRDARLVLAEDISERVAYERDLAWRAYHDANTGLLNLPALVEMLETRPRAQRESRYAVAYVRLRDLELLAPTLGRRAGEAILRAAAHRFSALGARFGDCAYVPAESFVLVARDAADIDAMLAGVVDATTQPVEVDGGMHPLEAWIGVAEGPGPDEDAEDVVGHAALAALQAKRDNVPQVTYSAALAEQASKRLVLAGRLRHALERGEFSLHFQPIRRLQDDRLVALEALLRWRLADGRFVSPAQFIPLCEESGLIVPIGQWVLEHAAQCHATLAAQGLGHVAIAVNVSTVQLMADTLPDLLRSLSIRHALPRGALHMELTESALLRRPDSATAQMRELRTQGVSIAIDDFGTGFSSMAYLRDLPLDCLKVDRSFVHEVDSDERKASICRAMIALGHGLDLKVVAEGVESAAQLDWLRQHGCDQAQGYHLGRPAPLDEVLRTLH